MDDKNRCIEELKALSNKKFVKITKRCTKSIIFALKYAKNIGYKQVLLQDMGRWMNYPKDCQRVKLPSIELKTNKGILLNSELKKYNDSILLITCSAGYTALHNMEEIAKICKTNNIFLINDISGSIGENESKIGDMIVGSFGRWKPLDLTYGGFIASNHELDLEEFDVEYDKLLKKLYELKPKLKFLYSICDKIKRDLSEMNIVHPDNKGTVIIIEFLDEKEKEKIIEYCIKNDFEYTECPRVIRILNDAISIEVKRKPYIAPTILS